MMPYWMVYGMLYGPSSTEKDRRIAQCELSLLFKDEFAQWLEYKSMRDGLDDVETELLEVA